MIRIVDDKLYLFSDFRSQFRALSVLSSKVTMMSNKSGMVSPPETHLFSQYGVYWNAQSSMGFPVIWSLKWPIINSDVERPLPTFPDNIGEVLRCY